MAIVGVRACHRIVAGYRNRVFCRIVGRAPRIRLRTGSRQGGAATFTEGSFTADGHRRQGVHRQCQFYDAVAGTRALDDDGIHKDTDGRRVNRKTVLVVTLPFANGGGQIRDGGIAHREVQDDRAVATVHRLQNQLVVTRCADIEAVLIIGLTLTDLRRQFLCNGLMQGKQKNRRVCAGIGIGAIIIVGTRLINGGVGQRPVELGAAGVHRHFHIFTVVDGEVQCDNAVATFGVHYGVQIVATFGQTGVAVPVEAAARYGGRVTFGGVADGDVPLVHDGASVRFRGRRDDGDYLRIPIGFVIKHKNVTGIHHRVITGRVTEGQVQHILRGAIFTVGDKGKVCPGLPCGKMGVLVCHSFTNGLVDSHGIHRRHRIEGIAAGIGDHDTVDIGGSV